MSKSLSVLIVDDEPEILEVFRTLVEEALPGARVLTSGDGRDALQRAGRQHFQLVVTDMKMPKLDGQGLIQSLAKLDQNLKPNQILVVSGALHSDDALRATGNVRFLAKPVAAEVFQAEIKKLHAELREAGTNPA